LHNHPQVVLSWHLQRLFVWQEAASKMAVLTVSCDAANENASVDKIAKNLSYACGVKIAAARLRSTTSEELGKRGN